MNGLYEEKSLIMILLFMQDSSTEQRLLILLPIFVCTMVSTVSFPVIRNSINDFIALGISYLSLVNKDNRSVNNWKSN